MIMQRRPAAQIRQFTAASGARHSSADAELRLCDGAGWRLHAGRRQRHARPPQQTTSLTPRGVPQSEIAFQPAGLPPGEARSQP